jgi:hypothetical protein
MWCRCFKPINQWKPGCWCTKRNISNTNRSLMFCKRKKMLMLMWMFQNYFNFMLWMLKLMLANKFSSRCLMFMVMFKSANLQAEKNKVRSFKVRCFMLMFGPRKDFQRLKLMFSQRNQSGSWDVIDVYVLCWMLMSFTSVYVLCFLPLMFDVTNYLVFIYRDMSR